MYSGCCWHMLLGMISAITRTVGTITKAEIISPLTVPNRDMNKAVATVVPVTAHKLVPVRAVEKNQSGLSRSLRVRAADRDPLRAFRLILLMSELTRAISPPENKPSRERQSIINKRDKRLSLILFSFFFHPDG